MFNPQGQSLLDSQPTGAFYLAENRPHVRHYNHVLCAICGGLHQFRHTGIHTGGQGTPILAHRGGCIARVRPEITRLLGVGFGDLLVRFAFPNAEMDFTQPRIIG